MRCSKSATIRCDRSAIMRFDKSATSIENHVENQAFF